MNVADSLVINLKDYSEVKLDSLDANSRETLSKFRTKNQDDQDNQDNQLCLNDICLKVQEMIIKTESTNITLLNGEAGKKIDLFRKKEDGLWTQGYIGVVSTLIDGKKVTLNIRSRFDDDNSRFLMYVFEKAFNVNGIIYNKMDVSGKKEHSWDFLLMIAYVRCLHDALKKGFFKQYQEYEYNDSNIKGRIDISRHMKENLLPDGRGNGKIGYTTREHTIDNPVNWLILRAYACLERRYKSPLHNLVNNDEIVKMGIRILRNEVMEWDLLSDKDAVKLANKKVVQPVFRNYEPLRKISISILKRLGVNSYSASTTNISGLLIDMPHLWEVFLHNTIFSKLEEDPKDYSQEKHPIWDGKCFVKPDFLLRENERMVVFDAKYRVAWQNAIENDAWGDDTREDVFQVMAYMLAFKCIYGGVIFPYNLKQKPNNYAPIFKLWKGDNTLDGQRFFTLLPYCIPNRENIESAEFRSLMDQESARIIEEIRQNECVKSFL